MMVGHGERDEQEQQKWRARFEQGRMRLSASVGEALAIPGFEESFDDESGDAPEPQRQKKPHTILIPPLLSLQSKQMPAVQIVQDSQFSTTGVDSPPETNPLAALPSASKKKRLGGHNTKVRLQTVSKTEKRGSKKMAMSPGSVETVSEQSPLTNLQSALANSVEANSVEANSVKEGITEKPAAVVLKRDERETREKLAGSGQILKGQSEATVQNMHVSSLSVVMVSLLGNPGPVVVQYYTLSPGYGFKLHLSAAASVDVPFNYVLLLGELF